MEKKSNTTVSQAVSDMLTSTKECAVKFSNLTAENVLSGVQGKIILGHVIQAINLSTINFHLGIAVNNSSILKPKPVQTEVQKKFNSLLNLDSERPLVKTEEQQLEDNKKSPDVVKFQSAIEGIQASILLAEHIKEISFDSADKDKTSQIKFEIEGGDKGGGLQTPTERIVSQGHQYVNYRFDSDKIIAQNKVIGKTMVDKVDENGNLMKDEKGKVIQVEGLTEQARKNIAKRKDIILEQVAESTKYKLAELESNNFELSDNADLVDTILNACKINNIDMNEILHKAVGIKYDNWNKNQNFAIDTEVLLFGQYLSNSNK